MRFPLFAFIAVVCLASTGCQKKEDPSAALPKVPMTAPLVAPAERSPYFDTVSGHLELGGVFYAYADVDGDVDRFGQMLTRFGAQAAAAQPAAAAAKQDYGALLKLLGLTDIKAVGMSSVAQGRGFRNQLFLFVPGGRHGLLALAGGAPTTFENARLAPADADVFAETELNMPEAYSTIKAVVAKVGGDALVAKFEAGLQGGSGRPVSPLALIQALSGRFTLIIRINPNDTMRIPGPNSVDLPGMSFFLRADNIGPVVEPLVAGEGDDFLHAEDGTGIYEARRGLPGTKIRPAIVFSGKSVSLASDRAFLLECAQRSSGLNADANFRAALNSVGGVGNGITYMTPRFFSAARKAVDALSAKNAQVAPALALWSGAIPALDRPLVTVRANLADGILYRSYSHQSMKEQALLLSPAGPLTIGLVAAMAIPAFEKVRLDSQEKTIQNNLRMLSVAADQFMLEKNRTEATYADLMGPNKYIRELHPVAGEDYTHLIIHANDRTLWVRTRTGKLVSIQRK